MVINAKVIFFSVAAVRTASVNLYHVYGDSDIVIALVFAALSIIYSKESISNGDHDKFNEAFKFKIYKVFKELQKPKASRQDPCFAPNLVVFEASNVPARSIPGE